MSRPEPQNQTDGMVGVFRFILFVAEGGHNSAQAHANLKTICEKTLPNRHHIEIVDVLDDYETALQHNILLTPALVVLDPPPPLTILGNLNDTERVIGLLQLT